MSTRPNYPDCALRAALRRGHEATSPPSAVQPQPLLGMFAHPALDYRRDRLHGGLDVDPTAGVARRLDRFADLGAKAPAGEADGTHAVNRAIEVPGNARDQRIGFAAPAEERHVHALAQMLVDQHP